MILVRTQGASEVASTVKTPLWFIFAKMLMSRASDRGSLEVVSYVVCKEYNQIQVSSTKG